MALLIVIVLGMGVMLALLGLFVRRWGRTGIHRFAAGTLFVLGVGALLVFSFPLVYPHHHHDTRWIEVDYRWNYPVDAAFGLVYWVAIVILVRRWKRSRMVINVAA